jgi:N-acetyltransferase
VAYAVAGRAGRRGFLQRLAVDPTSQGRGWGAALVVDTLHWWRRRGVTDGVVNTQDDNVVARALYRRLGFREETHGLDVMSLALA